MKKPKNVDEYLSDLPEEFREKAEQLRRIIRSAATEAEEVISYQMPAYKLNGMLVYFAVHKSHIGFYPTSAGVEAFRDELSSFKWAKGTIQFPLDKPLPLELIARIVRFRVTQNLIKVNFT